MVLPAGKKAAEKERGPKRHGEKPEPVPVRNTHEGVLSETERFGGGWEYADGGFFFLL